VAAVCGVVAQAYSLSSYKWAYSPVLFYVNPANADVSAGAAEAAVKVGMEVWNTQPGTTFRYQYGGRVNDTATMNDGRNVAIFRNATNGGSVASTYSWWSGGVRVDSDIIFWDAAYKFFTGTSGCSSGVYIEDFATHELGHALGLQHSSITTATMYKSTGWCSQVWRTLDADDIAGMRKLYGTQSVQTTNTAPSVSIQLPQSSGTFADGTVISFAGAAADLEDGSLTGHLAWSSNLDGQLGSGGSFSRTLSPGTHTVKAKVTDSDGANAQSSVSVTVTVSSAPAPTSPTGPALTAYGYKVKGLKRVDLGWTGLTATKVDVYRDGARITTTANDGFHTDALGTRGGGTHTYRVCDAGSSVCTSNAKVTF
jgi:hypothetical protein